MKRILSLSPQMSLKMLKPKSAIGVPVVSSTIISPPSSLCSFNSNAGVAGLLVGIPVILFEPAKGVPANASLVPFTIVILLPAVFSIVKLL